MKKAIAFFLFFWELWPWLQPVLSTKEENIDEQANDMGDIGERLRV